MIAKLRNIFFNMPLYKTITVNKTTKVYIWKIEESYEELSKGIELTPPCRERVDDMKSEIHRRGFMSVRHLLAEAGYVDKDLYYDDLGKPHLKDESHISITHSFNFSGIIVSEDIPVGIDIEKQRDKIVKIANKFTPAKRIQDNRQSRSFGKQTHNCVGSKGVAIQNTSSERP